MKCANFKIKIASNFQILTNDDMAMIDITAQNAKKMISGVKNMCDFGRLVNTQEFSVEVQGGSQVRIVG